jgi:hypothetical protein
MHRIGDSDITCLAFAMGRLLEFYIWNRQGFLSASNEEMVSYAMRCVAKASAETPHWQIIETYRNTAMQQNNIWSTAFKGLTKEIFQEVC